MTLEDGKQMVRVNTRISETANEWLDDQSRKTGIPKSTLILLAIENYIREKEAMAAMADMGQLVMKIDELQKTLERNERND